MSVQTVGRYELVRELGRGGMAIVYLGYDPYVKRQVAIKLLPRQFTFDPQFRARFQREAEIIAALEHPFIVPVHDFGGLDDQPYIVMRFMPGGSLLDKLHGGSISLPETARIISRVGEALDLAHSQGIIHRDIKPGNILFDARGEAFLSDFGIAKLSEATSALTGTGMIGTPEYMSPDQARGAKELDGRTDVYSLGVVFFQALTGQLPYRADTPMSMALAHITQPIPSIRSLNPHLPQGAEPIVARALAKEPTQRYSHAGEFARDVQRLADQPPAAPNYTVVEPWTQGQGATTVEPWGGSTVAEPLRPPPAVTGPPMSVPPTAEPRGPMTAPAPPPPQARSRTPMMAILGIGGAAALLIVCCIAAFALNLVPSFLTGGPTATAFVFVDTDTPQPPGAPTETPSPPPDIATNTPPAPTVVQIGGQGIAAPGASWPLVRIHEFEFDENLWPVTTDKDNFGTITRSIIGGKYVWDVQAAQGVVSNARPEMDFIGDFSVAVEARQISGVQGGEYGLVLRHDGANYYLFIVSENQEYAFFVRNNGEWTTLIDWTATTAVHPGQVNFLAVTAEGPNFNFFINGEAVGSATDTSLTSGEAGIAVQLYNAGDSARFEFDNFAIRRAWPVLVADTFGTNTHEWPDGAYDDERVHANRLVNGKYRFEVSALDGFVWRLNPDTGSVGDFHLSVDAQRVSGPIEAAYGVAFRDDGSNYYYFKISDDGYFRVALYLNGEWITIVDWTTSDAIRAGQVNHLAVLAEGDQLEFYINNVFVSQATDSRILSGETAVALELFEAGQEAVIEFDNFEVRTP